MQPRGACSCEWTKKAVTVEKADAVEKAKDASEKVAVAVEKADAVEKAEDAAEKVAAADNPRARGILITLDHTSRNSTNRRAAAKRLQPRVAARHMVTVAESSIVETRGARIQSGVATISRIDKIIGLCCRI